MKILLLIALPLMLSCQQCKRTDVPAPVITAKDTCKEVVKHWGKPPADIDNPVWNKVLVDSCGITVTYQEKYGTLVIAPCTGLWENSSQYMLTWKKGRKGLKIEKQNLVYITYLVDSSSKK